MGIVYEDFEYKVSLSIGRVGHWDLNQFIISLTMTTKFFAKTEPELYF